MLLDSYQRQIKDLRISLTDRCNFRCFYCRSAEDNTLAPKESILTLEEIIYLSEIFVSLGIEKIRLTGGEPLLRKNLERLIKNLSKLKNPKSKIQN
jgi:GTP 3',8-cyclase